MRLKCAVIVLCILCGLSGNVPAAAGTLPDSAYVPGVVAHAQGYTLSCEARAAVDWAAFWGVSLDESQFLSDLPSSDNPETGFVGIPNDAWGGIPPASYGVHAEPVARLLRANGLEAQAQKGLSWNDMRAEIAAGRPVIVWVIGQMWGGTPVTYTAQDGSTTTVARFEHTMILYGYDETRVHVADAYSGWNLTYPLDIFKASWDVLGNMAVTGQGALAPAAPAAPASSTPEGVRDYTVERGDYLSALAERFGTTWKTLAEMNNLAYPYVIYPGQKLSVPGGSPADSAVNPQPEAAVQATPTQNFHLALPLITNQIIPLEAAAVETAVPTPEPAVAPEERIYAVQMGDFLIGVAEGFNLDWRVLADMNGITYPYVIYPGQTLKLP